MAPAEALPKGCDCTAAVVDGDPVDVLAEASGRHDLLVIGSRGCGAVRATLAGTVGHQLATGEPVPADAGPARRRAPLHGIVTRRHQHVTR